MKKIALNNVVLLGALIALSGCIFGSMNVSVRSPAPVTVTVSEPELYIIPDTYVYYYQSNDGDVFFYDGYWWKSRQDSWYRSDTYSGQWTMVEKTRISDKVTYLPPRWRDNYQQSQRVKWNEVRAHHQEWERDKYWEKRGWKEKRDNENRIRADNEERVKQEERQRNQRREEERRNRDSQNNGNRINNR